MSDPQGSGGGQGQESLIESPKRPPQRKGCCAPCQWFKEKPLQRWPFALFLLFGILDFLWLLLYLTSGLTGYILAGICAIVMSAYGANHFRILLGLKEEVDRMSKLNKDFKEQNMALKMEVDKLTKAREQLSGVENGLRESNKKLKENLDKFRKLDENLKQLSADNIEGLEKLQKSSKAVMDKWKQSLISHEKAILSKVYDQFEMKDDDIDMTEDEFKQFFNALPQSYQERMRNMGKTFKDFAGADDKLDLNELKKLLDEFAEGEAEKGGSQ